MMRPTSRFIRQAGLAAASLVTTSLMVLLAVPAGASPYAADDSTTSKSTDSQAPNATFGIGPALHVPATQTVDGRPYLDYRASAGATVRDAVAVLNYGTQPLTLRVYATDAIQGRDGGFGLRSGDDEPTDAGSWFSLKLPRSGKVTVPPRQGNVYGRVEIPLEVKIPADASPGDHVAGVIASLETLGKNKEGTRIRFEQRVGVRTYFRLDGPLEPELRVDKLHTSFTAGINARGEGTTTVTYRVRNTGNVRMNAAQIVDVSSWFDESRIERPAPVQDLLPGSSIDVTHTFEDDVAIGHLETLVSLIATPVDPQVTTDRTPAQERITIWAWPWPLILIGLTIVLLALASYLYRRRRKRRKLQRAGTSGDGEGSSKKRAGDRGPLEPVARSLPALAIAAMAVVLVGPTAPAQADVTQPDGGTLMMEADRLTGDPARAITQGTWGHEGPRHDLGTYVTADFTDASGTVTDASQALWLERFGHDDFADLGIAFVRASPDGSTERPAVTPGENAGEAFEWFTGAGFSSGFTGTTNPETNQVLVVHTADEFRDWVLNGQPAQVFDDRLVAHDALLPDTPVSAHPQGRSIRNRWPAGEEISLVVFQFEGFDGDGIPLVAADENGRARSVWLTFETVASTTNPSVATSDGYRVLDTTPLPNEPADVPEALAAATAAEGTGVVSTAGAQNSGDPQSQGANQSGAGGGGQAGASGAQVPGTGAGGGSDGGRSPQAGAGGPGAQPASEGAGASTSNPGTSSGRTLLVLGALGVLIAAVWALRNRTTKS